MVTLNENSYLVLSAEPFWTEHRAGGHFDFDSENQYFAIYVTTTTGQHDVMGLQLGKKQAGQLRKGTLGDLQGTILSMEGEALTGLYQQANGNTVYDCFLSSSPATSVQSALTSVACFILAAVCAVLLVAVIKRKNSR